MTFTHDFKRFPELTNGQMGLYYFDSPHQQITEDFEAKVNRVIDGDTVILDWNGRSFLFPLRLLGIDAPELNEGGRESKSWLETQIDGKEVQIIIDEKQRVGKFGRLLGRIIFDGIDVQLESIALGHARRSGEELTPFPNFSNELRRSEF